MNIAFHKMLALVSKVSASFADEHRFLFASDMAVTLKSKIMGSM